MEFDNHVATSAMEIVFSFYLFGSCLVVIFSVSVLRQVVLLLFVVCLTSQQHAMYLRSGSAQIILRAATLR